MHVRTRWKACSPSFKCQHQHGNLTDASDGWSNSQVKSTASSYGYTIVTNVVRKGHYAARIEVRPGDDPFSGNTSERSEVLFPQNAAGTTISENAGSGTQFFGFSTRLDPAWVSPAPSGGFNWGCVLQLHGPDAYGTSPSLALNCTDRYYASFNTGDVGTTNNNSNYELNTGTNSLNNGTWTDWIMKVVFSGTTTGQFTLFRRDLGAADWSVAHTRANQPNLQYASPDTAAAPGVHYWKMGFYRPAQTTVTNILWNNGLLRATCWSGVNLAF